jgi:hypothetical protein
MCEAGACYEQKRAFLVTATALPSFTHLSLSLVCVEGLNPVIFTSGLDTYVVGLSRPFL